MLKPIPCTGKDVASALGLHERRISELTRVGLFHKPYELLACVHAYLGFLRQDVGPLKDQRVRVAKLKGDLLQLEYEELVGALVSRSAIDRAWFQATREARDGLKNIPARVAGLVAAESDQHKCFELIAREIDQALEGLTHAHTPDA